MSEFVEDRKDKFPIESYVSDNVLNKNQSIYLLTSNLSKFVLFTKATQWKNGIFLCKLSQF